MSANALRWTFDEDAEAYDRARPGYPGELVRDLATLAGVRPGARVAEIGPGTGRRRSPSSGWARTSWRWNLEPGWPTC